jgi:flavin reductase (DIM6/NTAB) family NADH-FMN oxidoreductase RutF
VDVIGAGVKRIAIIGAGQSGLQLGLGLLRRGYDVTLISERSADEVQHGHVLSSQCMFDSALETERELGLNYWESQCPKVEGIGFSVPDGIGGRLIDWSARLDSFAQSVDQRIKIPRWMSEFQARGGDLKFKAAEIEDLERLTVSHDLVIVASGKGELSQLFERDDTRSPYSTPQRILALTYITNTELKKGFPAISFNLVPNVGEYFVFPALTINGPCEIMVFECMPGGQMDCWADVKTPSEHLARSKEILQLFVPWEAERCRDAELTDENGVLRGSFVPVVRRPVAMLPSGRPVLGMADAVVLNDPLTGQGSNNAARCADIYLQSIIERDTDEADPQWMLHTFERYWTGYARWAVEWTNLLLKPPSYVLKIFDCAGRINAVGTGLVNGFDDPRTLFPWFMDTAAAQEFIDREARAVADRIDRRDFRRALGQFATGVTVVTARALDGRKIGVTVNSFSSVSLNPPLILWSLSREAPSFNDFTHAPGFAINILESGQHHLSRQFSTPLPDKFAGVEHEESRDGIPLLKGVIAQLLCRKVKQYDGGDHVIFMGEVEQYTYSAGEPLVFHSGRYRIATRHPDLVE